jgi:membrane protease YdiL (CAAX protease family)
MQTRLRGFIDNERVVLIITAVLFMLSHYPPYLIIGSLLPMSQVVCLLILGLVCGIQYNKTHNVLVPFITHYIYNMVTFN